MIVSNETTTSDVEITERTDILLSDSEDDNYSNIEDGSSYDGNESDSMDASVSDDDVPDFLDRASYFKDSAAVNLDFLLPADAKVKRENIANTKSKLTYVKLEMNSCIIRC